MNELDVLLTKKNTYWGNSTPLGHLLNTGRAAIATKQYANQFSKTFWKKGLAGMQSKKKIVIRISKDTKELSIRVNGRKL